MGNHTTNPIWSSSSSQKKTGGQLVQNLNLQTGFSFRGAFVCLECWFPRWLSHWLCSGFPVFGLWSDGKCSKKNFFVCAKKMWSSPAHVHADVRAASRWDALLTFCNKHFSISVLSVFESRSRHHHHHHHHLHNFNEMEMRRNVRLEDLRF